MNKKSFIIIASVITCAGLLWIILTPVLFPIHQAEVGPSAPHAGFPAPTFKLQTPDGSNISLGDYEGQPVLVFMWASWCSVCKATMPGLQQVYQSYQEDGFEILAVNATSQDNLVNALDYFQAQNYAFPMLLDQEGEVARAYQLRALPTAILIRPDGLIHDVIIGSGLSQGYLTAVLNHLLEGEE